MCQLGIGPIIAGQRTWVVRRWEKALTRLGESARQMDLAEDSPNKSLAGTLVAEISRLTMKDERQWIFPYCFSNWELRSG